MHGDREKIAGSPIPPVTLARTAEAAATEDQELIEDLQVQFDILSRHTRLSIILQS